MTPKIDDRARLSFLSDFRVNVQFDSEFAWVQLGNGTFIKDRTLRKALDEAIKWTKKQPKQGE